MDQILTKEGIINLNKLMSEIYSIPGKQEHKRFPNGFTSWNETHFEVVSEIAGLRESGTNSKIKEINQTQGTGGFYKLAEQLTDEFESLNKGREWDGEFFEELESFLHERLGS